MGSGYAKLSISVVRPACTLVCMLEYDSIRKEAIVSKLVKLNGFGETRNLKFNTVATHAVMIVVLVSDGIDYIEGSFTLEMSSRKLMQFEY